MRHERNDPAGLLYALAAYGWWGFAPLYFKAIRSVPPAEILAHRILWSVVMLALIVVGMRRLLLLQAVFRSRRTLLLLSVSTILVAVNWFIFIWAVTRNHVMEASLGYFINPLISVLLGFFFLHERLRKLEIWSVALAAAAVIWLVIAAGVFPVIAISLAVTFGLYGFVRKQVAVSSIEALLVETLFLVPVAGGYLIHLAATGKITFGQQGRLLDLLLIAAGPVTALPLIWFASAVRRLRLAAVGLMQYVAPTLQFILAVTLFREPFTPQKLVAFVLIWTAVAVFAYDNYRRAAEAGR